MPIKHSFTSAKADGDDATRVRPTNWNADHNAMPFRCPVLASLHTWTNMPAALTILLGDQRTRTRYDLTYATQVRLLASCTTAGVAGAELRGQYSTDDTAWAYLDGGTGPLLDIATAGNLASSLVTLVAGAKADVHLRVVGINGDGVVDPQFGNVVLEFR